MAVQSPAKYGKSTSEVLPHLAASQFDQRICACQRRSAGIWGSRAKLQGTYYSSSVSLADISSPNSPKPYDALWSMLKQVPTINRVLSHCPRAMDKLQGKVTPSGAERISTSACAGGHHGLAVRLSAQELTDRGCMLPEDEGV